MNDPRKPLFPDDDESLPPLDDEDKAEIEDSDAAPTPEPEPVDPVYTPPEERFPPLDPAQINRQAEALASPPRKSYLLHNLATIFFVLATLAMIGYFALLWVNPYHALNPLPPYTPLPILITATPLPPTETVPPTLTPTIPTATFTPLPALIATTGATFTPAPFPFTTTEIGVEYQENSNESGCDWSSIAGQVIDLDGAGVVDYGLRVRAQDGPFNATVTTGEADEFGPGGFEVPLANTAQFRPYIVQLLDPSGEPVSDEYLVVTSDQCDQTVAVLSFVQNR